VQKNTAKKKQKKKGFYPRVDCECIISKKERKKEISQQLVCRKGKKKSTTKDEVAH
jgi:hypothetical protein